MTRYCVDFAWGGLRHFPAGTYYQQTASEWGRTELEMMDLVGRVRGLYYQADASTWTPAQIDLAAWIEKSDAA